MGELARRLQRIAFAAIAFIACGTRYGSESEPDPSADAGTSDASVANEAGAQDASEAAAPASAYATAVLADLPAAYWRMGSTSVIPDESGNGNDLILVGTGHSVVPGATHESGDHAIRFDGTSSGARALPSKAFNFSAMHSYTLECWTTFSPLDGGAQYPFVLGYSSSSGAARTGYIVYFSGNKIITERSEGQTNSSYLATPVPATASFHHVVIVYDGSNLSIFVDGLRMSTQPSAFGIPDLDAPLFSIGFDGATSSNYFSGAIDEVAVYDHALTDAQVGLHYQTARQ